MTLLKDTHEPNIASEVDCFICGSKVPIYTTLHIPGHHKGRKFLVSLHKACAPQGLQKEEKAYSSTEKNEVTMQDFLERVERAFSEE